MDEKPDQIIDHIEQQRDRLGRNLNELESRVRRSTDWRTYYDRNPMLILGAALGGGLLLGATLAPDSDRRSSRHYRISFPRNKSQSKSSVPIAGQTASTSHISGSYDAGNAGTTGAEAYIPVGSGYHGSE